jgi:ATP-dependent DNA helicase RecG
VKRLEILKQSSDGFYIANEDLKMRGPGDLFGIRQSGDLAFSIADIYQDADVMKQAAMAAEAYEKGTLVCTDLERSRINRKLQAQMEKYSNQMSL